MAPAAVAGSPQQLNIMYGLAGERRLTEFELPWLPGYMNSAPVRIGNAAWEQFQLDVFGEVCDTLHVAARLGLPLEENVWRIERELGEYLEQHWRDPDEGIWEIRGPRQHFVHSKMMAWVAFDRLVKTVERFGAVGTVDRWRTTRDTIHREVCEQGFDTQQNAFVQAYGSTELDASLLMMPLVGFLRPAIRGSAVPWRRSSASSWPTASCFAIALNPMWTAYLRVKEHSCLVRFGWLTTWRRWGVAATPRKSSNGWQDWPTTWG